MISVDLNNVNDIATKQAFERLIEQLNQKTILTGSWDYVEYTFPTVTSTIFELNHRLKFKPTDIIELHRDSSLSSVTYDKNKFTQTTVYLTVTGSGTIRFLVGKQNRG